MDVLRGMARGTARHGGERRGGFGGWLRGDGGGGAVESTRGVLDWTVLYMALWGEVVWGEDWASLRLDTTRVS